MQSWRLFWQRTLMAGVVSAGAGLQTAVLSWQQVADPCAAPPVSFARLLTFKKSQGGSATSTMLMLSRCLVGGGR
jgi:hypothetical protein